MTILSQEIGKKVKGSLMENEDWWRLCYDTESGDFYVEHEWSYVDPYKLSKPADSGKARIEIDDYSGAGKAEIAEAKAALQAKAKHQE